MRIMRFVTVGMAICAVLAVLAMPAVAALKLPVQVAAEKSFIFAKHTCRHDQNCVRYGVTNCERQSLHVVLCRIFDERHTEVQGKYSCTRLIRVALDPVTIRIKVTGLGHWQC